MNGGPAPAVVPEGVSWRVADTAHASFGLEIPAAIIGSGEHFITRGKVSLVAFDPKDEDDPELVTAELVSVAEAHVWRRS